MSSLITTMQSYIDIETVKFDSYPSMQKIGTGEGIIIRPNTASCLCLKWGQKMKFTPNRITFIGDRDMYFFAKCGSRQIFKIGYNVEFAKSNNISEEEDAAAYWEDVENSWG